MTTCACCLEVAIMMTYLNLGCLLMASSGKNSDFDAPFSTGVGRCSGLVKPGQPNLNKGAAHIELL